MNIWLLFFLWFLMLWIMVTIGLAFAFTIRDAVVLRRAQAHYGSSVHQTKLSTKRGMRGDRRPSAKILRLRAAFPESRLTAAERALFLRLHNEFRALSKRRPLQWCDELARSAEAYADFLQKHKADIHHPENDFDDELYLKSGGYSQNLSQFTASRKRAGIGSIEEAVQLWKDECNQYDPKRPTRGNVGHFTAMLWRESKRLGCAYRKYHTHSGRFAEVYVCHQEPGGNWLTADGGYDLFDEQVGSDFVCERAA